MNIFWIITPFVAGFLIGMGITWWRLEHADLERYEHIRDMHYLLDEEVQRKLRLPDR